MLTETEARRRVSAGPLEFGKADLVDAHTFLQALDEARRAIPRCTHGACPRCGGRGTEPPIQGDLSHNCDLCPNCGGDGTATCLCFIAIRGDAVAEARRQMRDFYSARAKKRDGTVVYAERSRS